MDIKSLSDAFYRHPAFFLHRMLGSIGRLRFNTRNSIITAACVAGLTACAWVDGSLLLGSNGYGYLEHPGIFGWYAIQLFLPASIYATLRMAARNAARWQRIGLSSRQEFREGIADPLILFVGLATPQSRRLYSLLFTLGFAGFAWNTYQNASPGTLAPGDFWDSIHFIYGYIGSRIYKFYVDALLLPSVIHIFTGVVVVQLNFLRRLVLSKVARLAPFDSDRCGGLGFLADSTLSPTIVALLISGGAFFGAVYTHRALDISTGMGAAVEVGALLIFYIAPTFLLRSIIQELKRRENGIIHTRQESYYRSMLSGALHGEELNEARAYMQYFGDVGQKIAAIPNWPHFARVFGTFSITISLLT